MSIPTNPLFRWSRVGCFVLLLSYSGLASTASIQKPANSMPGAELFAEGPLRRLELEIGPQDLERLAKEARDFVRATLHDGDTTYTDVAVHLKGSVGSFRPVNDKPGLTLDFARYRQNQRFHGLRRVYLNNSVEDPSYSNEILASEVFREGGVPCPRVTRVIVTLNGRKLGLYVLKEGFTEDFLSGYFQTVGANLFEPDEGHDVNEHLKKGSVQGVTSNRRTLRALSQAVLETDPHERWESMSAVLEMDRFVRFMALEVMLCHRDGYCLARNNFRVYENLDTGKMVFLPQGMDQLFGIPELPWVPHMAGLVARAVMETPEGSERYAQVSRELFGRVFQVEKLTNRVHQLAESLKGTVAEPEFDRIETSAKDLIGRIVQRHRSLEVQMSSGHVSLLSFSNGVAYLTNWTKAAVPASGRLSKELSPDGIPCLEIMTREEACPFWSTKALLGPGRYRFEGKARVAGVDPLGFGTHQGAGLRVGGDMRKSPDLLGTTQWQAISAPFEVQGAAQEIEFICELRARLGEVWFEASSLCVVREP